MKRLIKRVHHFTRCELVLDEILILLTLVCILSAAALAAVVVLPIRATIVQCGEREDLPAKCREDERCCRLLEQSATGSVTLYPQTRPGPAIVEPAAIVNPHAPSDDPAGESPEANDAE